MYHVEQVSLEVSVYNVFVQKFRELSATAHCLSKQVFYSDSVSESHYSTSSFELSTTYSVFIKLSHDESSVSVSKVEFDQLLTIVKCIEDKSPT